MSSDLSLPPAIVAALTPRFTVEREIGAGGMAIVYLAKDEKNDRPVALKVMRRGSDIASDVERFEREIKLLARLQHPLILPLHDSGMAGDTLYFVMPFVDGETLRDRLNREGRLSADDTVRIATEVSDALAYAHAQGVVHRDIKPENIMLWRGHAVVADFGIAGLARDTTPSTSRLTQMGMSLGTPAYMSPEQAAGELDIGPAADQYSLGVVIYELLTGAPPFSGFAHSVLIRHLTEKPSPVIKQRPDISQALSDAVDRALAKSPNDRWPSITALRDALHGAVTVSMSAAAPPMTGDSRPSLVVLPFTNVGGSAESEFFSDGLTEELIGALARLPRLRVVSRTSAFSFRGRDVPLAEIGAQLRVGFVLTGSVRRAGERLRLSAHLSRVADDTLLWSETYERHLNDVFEVQDDLSRRIVGTVGEALGTTVISNVPKANQPSSMVAYDQYLLGRHHWAKRGMVALREGLACFQRAIEADPNYAPAHAGIADSYSLLVGAGATPAEELYGLAKAAARRAIELDPKSSEAWASLGFVKMSHDWDLEGARFDLKRATELNPSNATAWQWYAGCLRALGNFDESLAASHQALALDPFAVATSTNLALSQFFARDFESAALTLERAIAMEPRNEDPYNWLTSVYLSLGRPEEAQRVNELAIQRIADAKFGESAMRAAVYWRLGRHDEARVCAQEMLHTPFAPDFFMALIYKFMDDKEEMYRRLEHGVDTHAPFMHWLRTFPILATEWESPRFADLVRRMGLGEPMKFEQR